ncbi:hypothetical protein FRC07_002364 [Ceratobasidium sp. 392]|nr:hypothetical protein FRC07_002364 [Ceratobasidium sp. 392]
MSTRFVAPPPPPPLRAPDTNVAQPSPAKNGQFPPPPPLHPALARRRTPIPSNGEPIGALNSSPASRNVSPAPPLPRRPSQSNQLNLPDLDIQSSSTNVFPQPVLSDTLSSDFDSTYTPSNSNVSLASEVPQTPLLLVTPVEAASADNVSYQSPLKTDTLPPYASQSDIPTEIYLGVPEHTNGTNAPSPGLDTSVPGPQYHEAITDTSAQRSTSPPVHPIRQPSSAPSFINLPVPSPTLRYRSQSNSSYGSDAPASRPAIPEQSRKGSGASILTLKDVNLTDEDLRTMYDAEEVERYLRLFATRVNEVTMHPDHADASVPTQVFADEEDWVSLSAPPPKQIVDCTLPPNLQSPSTPFEYIAALIYPYIPQAPPPPAKRRFRLSRAANSAQRLYMAVYPAYVPALVHLGRLASWRDPKKSGFWCGVFWAAWAAGLLTPLILGRILYAMVTGGTVTRQEIRRRREAAREAEILGRAIEGGVPGIGNTSKLITLTMGIFFWFIPPIVKHLPKLPPAFDDAPTDAEVAMDLISQRVARGERVIPKRISRRKKDKDKDQIDSKSNPSASNLNLADTLLVRSPSTTSLLPGSDESEDEATFVVANRTEEAPPPHEDRLRRGAVRAWNWLGKTKELMDQVRGVEGQGTVYAAPKQSFPAHHRSRPGMLIITPTLLTFSPLFASATPSTPSPTSHVIKVDTEHLRGVKKVSPSGLLVRYVKGSEVVEERFFIPAGRDEAFAILVGWGGGRWKHV